MMLTLHDKQNVMRALRLTLFSFLFFLLVPHVLAVGISPSKLIVDDVLPNSSVPTYMTFTRRDTEEDELMKVTLGGDAKKFIEMPEGDSVIMKKGKNQYKFPILVKPGNVGDGIYNATITVSQTALPSKDGEEHSGSVNLSGAQAGVRITVSNKEIETFEIRDVKLEESEINKPLGVAYIFDNKGNVGTKLGKVHVLITERFTGEEMYQEDLDVAPLEVVDGFQSAPQTLVINAKLSVGAYYGKVTFYNRKGNLVHESDPLSFQIWPEGSLAQDGKLSAFSVDKTGEYPSYLPGEIVKILGTFQNTGAVGIKVALTIEIYKGEQRIEVLKTDPLFAAVRGVAEFESTYKPPEVGEYVAKGYVAYGAGKTQVSESKFRVAVPSIISENSGSMMYGGIALGIVVLLALLFFFWRRRKSQPAMPFGAFCPVEWQQASQSPPAPPSPPVQ